jgi:phage repressor protein C with HTH and peptisase S24 domain
LGKKGAIITHMDRWKEIKEKIQEKYPKIEVFAKENGINYNTLSGWISKNRPPRVDEAIKIARGLGTTVEQIFSDSPQNMFIIRNHNGREMQVDDDLLLIPVLPQKVAAGHGQAYIDDVEIVGQLPFLKRMLRGTSPAGAKALEVRGDSMTGVNLFDGDLVVFVPGIIRGDGIYVLAAGDELIVKRVEFDMVTKRIRIMSENTRYPDRIESADGQTIRVVGKVFGWVHSHPY